MDKLHQQCHQRDGPHEMEDAREAEVRPASHRTLLSQEANEKTVHLQIIRKGKNP